MSQENITPKDLQMSKTDRRVLLRTLEKFYLIQLRQWKSYTDRPFRTDTATMIKKRDQAFRLRIKPIEMVLHSLGSEFMSHVKITSIRKTFTIAAQTDGVLESERQTLDYFRRWKRKRNSDVQIPVKNRPARRISSVSK